MIEENNVKVMNLPNILTISRMVMIPVFIMFASTFKVLTGLSLAIVLARFSCTERSDAMPAPEPTQWR